MASTSLDDDAVAAGEGAGAVRCANAGVMARTNAMTGSSRLNMKASSGSSEDARD
jgi:hypothetical protein